MSTITYIVKVASAQFTIDDAVAPKLTFRDGDTYEFDQADSSNSGHILQFSITSNNSGASEYTTGVTKTGTPGSAGAKTTIITSTSTTDTLYYYSSGGGTHGEEFSNSGFNTTAAGVLKPIVGGAAEKWGSMVNHSIDQLSVHTPMSTTERDALTPAVGMMLYNTTIGVMQQYSASGWASIDSPPTVTSLNYPGDDTALDTVGEFNLSCTTQTSTTVLVPGSTMPTVGQVVKGTGISAPVNNLTCGLTNTDATVTVAGSTTGLVVGMTVAEFTGVPARATILSIITDTSFELSAVATATNASAVLSFNTTVESVSGTTSFVITPTATASATVTLTFNTQTLIITGTNFSTGATVTIDGTAPSTVSRDSSTQITVTGTPAKTAGTKVDGLVVTNVSGLAASINVDYSALPAWTTTSGALGTLFITGSAISAVDLAATNATSYALTTGSFPPGLSIANAGDPVVGRITGTIIGSVYTTYNITVTATDAEAQSSPRLFNIITSAYPTGGNVIVEPGAYTGGGFRSHTFTSSGTFTVNSAMDFDILIVGGGGGGNGATPAYVFAGGGGGGGVRELIGQSIAADDYTVTIGIAGVGGTDLFGANCTSGGNSSLGSYVAVGGGKGATYSGSDGGDGGSGGGGATNGTSGDDTDSNSYGSDGGDGTGYTSSTSSSGGGGGGAGGTAGSAGFGGTGGAGAAGRNNLWRTGVNVMYGSGGGGAGGISAGTASSGGGAGSAGSAGGSAGTVNTGGGGGGAGSPGSGTNSGGAGGTGIVVIRYAV